QQESTNKKRDKEDLTSVFLKNFKENYLFNSDVVDDKKKHQIFNDVLDNNKPEVQKHLNEYINNFKNAKGDTNDYA
ncbi:MAG: hypothetical protein LBQ59_00105, partial [Candidatus Peribacteria bacterium]|nr:hypothetical protein [Candidatus Peribacteria bacterium]